ncbi:MAG: hypothetical protein KAR20_08165 [Candidatus Heimdallarchaeota archaeon]|nr:hypothetical protein [Candidatus Heimdallarchaeota archaeon]
MKKFDSISKGQIFANILLGIMILLTMLSMTMDSNGEFGLQKNQRAQVNAICIEGDWDECHDFGERALIEITEEKDPSGNGEVILRIRKVQ